MEYTSPQIFDFHRLSKKGFAGIPCITGSIPDGACGNGTCPWFYNCNTGGGPTGIECCANGTDPGITCNSGTGPLGGLACRSGALPG